MFVFSSCDFVDPLIRTTKDDPRRSSITFNQLPLRRIVTTRAGLGRIGSLNDSSHYVVFESLRVITRTRSGRYRCRVASSLICYGLNLEPLFCLVMSAQYAFVDSNLP
jgi:hypothetical protein